MGRKARAKRDRAAGEEIDLKLLQRQFANVCPEYAVEAVLEAMYQEYDRPCWRALRKLAAGQLPGLAGVKALLPAPSA